MLTLLRRPGFFLCVFLFFFLFPPTHPHHHKIIICVYLISIAIERYGQFSLSTEYSRLINPSIIMNLKIDCHRWLRLAAVKTAPIPNWWPLVKLKESEVGFFFFLCLFVCLGGGGGGGWRLKFGHRVSVMHAVSLSSTLFIERLDVRDHVLCGSILSFFASPGIPTYGLSGPRQLVLLV